MGVRISGIDIRGADTAMVGELRSLLLDHQLLVIAGQHLPRPELQEFGCKWGELLTHPSGMDAKSPYVQVLSSRKGVRGQGIWCVAFGHELASDTAVDHDALRTHDSPLGWRYRIRKSAPCVGVPGSCRKRYSPNVSSWFMFSRTTRRTTCISTPAKGSVPKYPTRSIPSFESMDETHRPALYVNPEFTSHHHRHARDRQCAHVVSTMGTCHHPGVHLPAHLVDGRSADLGQPICPCIQRSSTMTHLARWLA